MLYKNNFINCSETSVASLFYQIGFLGNMVLYIIYWKVCQKIHVVAPCKSRWALLVAQFALLGSENHQNSCFCIASSTLLCRILTWIDPERSEQRLLRLPLLSWLNQKEFTYELGSFFSLIYYVFTYLVLQVQLKVLYSVFFKAVFKLGCSVKNMGNFVSDEKFLVTLTGVSVSKQ